MFTLCKKGPDASADYVYIKSISFGYFKLVLTWDVEKKTQDWIDWNKLQWDYHADFISSKDSHYKMRVPKHK